MVEKRAFAALLEECAVSTKVAELTVDEFKQIIEEAVERKLSEMLGNPDAGLELRPGFE